MGSLLRRTSLAVVSLLLLSFAASSQGAEAKPKKKQPPFTWVSDVSPDKYPNLNHGTFFSTTNQTDVGYFIYLPTGYDDPANASQRYPVVYYLHGGRPGGEQKSISLVPDIHRVMESGKVSPMIYVFVNGGKVSHYDYPQLKSYGETATIKELIPHIDATYRTIADRSGRGLEGFSQGGRGTGRFMFKHPELFCSVAPMGGGHQHEKRISENNGDEGSYQFEQANNTWDLARAYASGDHPKLNILVAFGDKDFNYEANLEWTAHLKSLGIPFERIIVPDVPHSAREVYKHEAERILKFHADNFAK